MITLSTVPSLVALEKVANSSLDELHDKEISDLTHRLRALKHISVRQGAEMLSDPYSRVLLGWAIDDASYVALGARKALISAGIDMPEIQPAIKESKANLLTIADLGEPGLRNLQGLWTDLYENEISIPLQMLTVNTIPVTTVNFTEPALEDINRYLKPGSGCPARGAIMDRFFDRFVDVVLV